MSAPTTVGSSSSSDDPAGGGLVSKAERTAFVEAVLAAKLETDFTAVAYHFEGWLDKGAREARLIPSLQTSHKLDAQQR